MTIKVIEIIGRSTQGITRPFLCRGDDGRQYYVKGNGAGRRALISEWIAGQLGLCLGLPIPPFVQATIPPELIEFSARDDIRDLGTGVGFGSELVTDVVELPYLFIGQVDPRLRAKTLLFDWWICNGDRALTEDGGNVNLLWDHRGAKLHVIDQNLAFDSHEIENIWFNHVFKESSSEWSPSFQNEMSKAMSDAMAHLQKWWLEMPAEWSEVDAGLSLADLEKMLWRFDRNSRTFWRTQ